MLMRASAARTHHTKAALQCCVDDPKLGFRSIQDERDETCAVLVLSWLALWCFFSWHTGLQCRVDWSADHAGRSDQVLAVTVANEARNVQGAGNQGAVVS